MEAGKIEMVTDPIEECLDQMTDLLDLRKWYRPKGARGGPRPDVFRAAVITLADEIRRHQLAAAGGGLSHMTLIRFTRRIPVEQGWYWLRGKLDCDVMVYVFHEPDGVWFCDGLQMWTEADPKMKNYEFAGPIPAGV